MKTTRSYRTVPVEGRKGRTSWAEVDREVLGIISRRKLRLRIIGDYVLVEQMNGTPVLRLHLYSYDIVLGPFAPRREGYEVHHRDLKTFNNRIENLELLTAAEHRALHRRLEMYARDRRRNKSLRLGDLWRVQVPKTREPPSTEQVMADAQAARQDCKEFESRGLTSRQEDALLCEALAANFEFFFKDAQVAYAGISEKAIPRNVTDASFLDKKSKDAVVRPIRRGCLPEEASFVCLLALFQDSKAALAHLNHHLPDSVKANLAQSRGVNAAGMTTGEEDMPGFHIATLERFGKRPAVYQALQNLRRFHRLPKVAGHWRREKMRDRRPRKSSLPTEPTPGQAYNAWIASRFPPQTPSPSHHSSDRAHSPKSQQVERTDLEAEAPSPTPARWPPP